MIFLALLLIPVIISVASYFFLDSINWKEFLISLGVQVVVAAISALIISYGNTSDHEIWNGVVTKKYRQTTSCSHSYPCRCREKCTGTGKSRSCQTVCDTCYRHIHDYNWVVESSSGEYDYISRVDSQGLHEPPRWAQIVLGEPTSHRHLYTNYIKGSPDTLFRRQGFEDKYQLPNYPDKIFDYYRLNRFVAACPVKDVPAWNTALSILNGEMGPVKEVNMVVVATQENHDYFFALQEHWLGGKDNDVILVIGLEKDCHKIAWADVMAWSTTEDLHIQLRDAVMDIGVLDREKIMSALKFKIHKYYHRKPIEDFDYLKASIKPTMTQWIVSMVIGIIIAIGLAITFHIYEIE